MCVILNDMNSHPVEVLENKEGLLPKLDTSTSLLANNLLGIRLMRSLRTLTIIQGLMVFLQLAGGSCYLFPRYEQREVSL